MLSINRKLSHKGFSLLELMVAVVILAIAIFGIFHAYSTGFMGMADARDRTVATNYAREEMENVKNNSSWRDSSSSYSSEKGKFLINVIITDPNEEDLCNITTTISWDDRNGNPKEVKLDTLIYDY